MASFHREDALQNSTKSRRTDLSDSVVWLNNKNGMYSVRSGYHVARKILREENWVESSRGPVGQQEWRNLWKLVVSNKIKVFGWRACQEILQTRVNFARRRIILDNVCQGCKRSLESVVHTIWECCVAQDVWAGSSISLQKCSNDQHYIIQLLENLLERLSTGEFELFLAQAWIIRNQRNTVVHGGQLRTRGG